MAINKAGEAAGYARCPRCGTEHGELRGRRWKCGNGKCRFEEHREPWVGLTVLFTRDRIEDSQPATIVWSDSRNPNHPGIATLKEFGGVFRNVCHDPGAHPWTWRFVPQTPRQ